MLDLETQYNKEMKKIDQAVKETKGLARAYSILEFVKKENEHPHPSFTFNQMIMERSSDKTFATNIKREFSYLIALRKIDNQSKTL